MKLSEWATASHLKKHTPKKRVKKAAATTPPPAKQFQRHWRGIFADIRFKDDYRILTKSESDAKSAIKMLQAALKEYCLELSDDKTKMSILPDGLFREWVSMYHAANPKKKKSYRWKEFRELYLSVLRIDKSCPGTGVIDRFLADIVAKEGRIKVRLKFVNLQKVISMLLMLATLRIKSFPKIIAILESILRSPHGAIH